MFPENPEYAKMRQGDVILTLPWRHGENPRRPVLYAFITDTKRQIIGLYVLICLIRNMENPFLW